MTIRRAAVILAALCMGQAAGADDRPWRGIWSAELEWCVNAGFIGSRTPVPIALTRDEFLGYENSCQFKRIWKLGAMDAWQVRASCFSEGSRYDETLLLLLEAPDALWIVRGGEPVRFARCRD